MNLALEPRPGAPLRCAVCHDDAAHPEVCSGCGAALHPDCRVELGSCPTLGCRAGPRPRDAKPGRRRRAVALGVLVVGLFAWGSGLAGSAYRAAAHDQWPALRSRLRPGSGRSPLDLEVALQRLTSIPGNAEAYVALGGEGHVFSTGWRLSAEEADVVPYPGDPERDLLRISCSNRGGRAVAAEYYGVTPDDRLALVRLEDQDGASCGLVNYGCSDFRIGPPPPSRTAAGWEAALASNDPVERLEALQWVGGEHELRAPNASREVPDDCGEPRGDAELAIALRSDAGVLALVLRLADDPDRWVAESAREALVGLLGERLDASAALREAKRRDEPAGALATFDELLDLALRPDVLPHLADHRLAPLLEERARLRLRLGQTRGAVDDLIRRLPLGPSATPWLRFQLGCAELLHGDREAGLAELRAIARTSEWPSLYAQLWIAAVTGGAPRGRPEVGEEGWLDPVWAAAVGELSVEELLARADRWTPGRATPSQRRCVVHCFAGAILERLGRPDEALAQYRASVAANEVGWTEHDWASCRLAQRAR